VFRDRRDAAEALAVVVQEWRTTQAGVQKEPPIVLGLPRGGVPVAAQVAQLMGVAWDVLIVRKVSAPDQPEYAIGAVGEGEVEVRHQDTITSLDEAVFRRSAMREHRNVAERVRMFRQGRPMVDIRNRVVVIVDDGIATGSTMAAAVAVAREHGAQRVVVAAPVGSIQAVNWLRRIADEVLCVTVPPQFLSVGQFYRDFTQVGDDEVITLLDSR
jgi:putative phosphoribosyl transferase